jgi:hypothetical protein
MKLTKDEEMLVLLYGDGTREGLQKALMEMQKTLQADETELREMTDSFLISFGICLTDNLRS